MSSRSAPQLVALWTTLDYDGAGAINCQYYLDYTGAELLQAALCNLGAPYDNRYRALLRGADGSQRWVSSSRRLRDQGVTDGLLMVLAIPSAAADPGAPAYVTSAGSQYLPITSTYDQLTTRPSESTDLSPFYVDLSDYVRVRKLGMGAFGAVYLTRKSSTGEEVALKELCADTSNPAQRQSFEREVSILATVRHPALLGLHGCTPFDDAGGRGPCVLTPFMAGGSVDDLFKQEQQGRAPPTWDNTRKLIVLLGVASGMMFLHDNRIIHRDLKPANVLLNTALEPKIADFGLSKFVPACQTLFQTIRGGTAQFMAPEIYMDARYGFKVDVYAFGVMMYMIVTGLEPFHDVTSQMVLARKVNAGERPPIPDWVPECMRRLIERCWDTNPEQRPHFNEIVYRLGEESFLEALDANVGAFKDYQATVAPTKLQAKTPIQLAEKLRAGPVSIIRKKPARESLREMADAGDPFACAKYGMKIQSDDPAAAFGYFQRAAEMDDTTGIVRLGKCYWRGIGVARDPRQAVALFARAAERDDAEALDCFGQMFRFAVGVNRDLGKAAQLFKKAADAGHVRAMCHYGELLEEGRGVLQDIPQAIRYFRSAADQAGVEGMTRLADMYLTGHHIERNPAEARRLYELAAADGVPEATYALCELLQYGDDGVKPDLERAAMWAQQSAEQGQFLGMIEWADILENGVGVAADPEKAREVLARALSAEFQTDQNNFAYCLEHGKGCRPDIEKAIKYYKIAAQNGNASSQFNLALLYGNGTGVPRDVGESAKWYKMAADKGHDGGLFCYGCCLRSGEGTARNFAEAMRYFKMAAEKHHPAAFRMIGLMHEKGEGVPVNLEESVRWYRLAAERRDPPGMAYLADMLESGKGTPVDMVEAVRLYQGAAQMDSKLALLRLAAIYRDGRGVTRSIAEARRLLTRARAIGAPEAAGLLESLPAD